MNDKISDSSITTGLRGKFLISIAFGALIFIALSVYANLKELARSFLLFNWFYLPLILALAFLNYIVRFIRWEYYLKAIGISIEKRSSFLIFLSGLTMSVTPGKFGEVLKSHLLKELDKTPISRSAPIVLAERFTDFVALILLSTAGVFAFAYGAKVLIVSSVLSFGFLLVITSKSASGALIAFLSRIPRFGKIAHKLEEVYNSTYELLRWSRLLPGLLLGVSGWFWECVGFYVILSGFEKFLPLGKATFVYALATIAGAITMLPGGIGATEGSMTGLLHGFGIGRPVNVAAVLIVRVCTLWFAVVVGTVGLILFRRKWREVI